VTAGKDNRRVDGVSAHPRTTLLLYTHAFAPQVGGVETIMMELARGLAGILGADRVTVVTPAARGEFDDAALPFRVVRQPGIRELWRLLGEADVIHLAGPVMLPLFLGLLRGKPVVVEHHGFQTACPNGQLVIATTGQPCPGHFRAGRHRECLRCNAGEGWLRSLRMWLLTFPRRWLASRAHANVMPTRWLGRVLGLPRPVVIAHGIAAQSSAPAEASAPANEPLFAYLGRLVPTKGVHVLLEAVRMLRARKIPARLRVIGKGPEQPALERRAKDLGLNGAVEFLGYLPRERADLELARALAVVMPSVGGEVFGLAAAENMLSGRAVVASDLGALAEVVGDAGYVFPVADAAALAAQMESVWTDSDRTARIRRQARERIRTQFTVEQMCERHAELYSELATAGTRNA
jgi:glycosyltransferase involved in cell wall biosynthesis